MYTLSRIPVVETIGNIEHIYHFDVCNFINDKMVCRLSVTEKPKGTFRGGDTVALYDFVVRDTNELNDLYNNPEAALEYMAKESFGHRFVYFEFLLDDGEKHHFVYRERDENFLRYIQIRKNFSNISEDGILVQQCAKDSTMFDWDAIQYDRLVYKGYAFINEMWEPEEFWEYYKDEIIKQIEYFKNYEIGE